MSRLIDELRKQNCDITGAMERFLDDQEFYTECLKQTLYDENFEKLGNAIENNEAKHAFDYAHTLKGVIANMGITPIYDIIVKLVEPLRNGKTEGLMSVYEQLISERDRFRVIMNENI